MASAHLFVNLASKMLHFAVLKGDNVLIENILFKLKNDNVEFDVDDFLNENSLREDMRNLFFSRWLQ